MKKNCFLLVIGIRIYPISIYRSIYLSIYKYIYIYISVNIPCGETSDSCFWNHDCGWLNLKFARKSIFFWFNPNLSLFSSLLKYCKFLRLVAQIPFNHSFSWSNPIESPCFWMNSSFCVSRVAAHCHVSRRFSSFLVSPRDHCELQEPDHKPRGRARLGELWPWLLVNDSNQ